MRMAPATDDADAGEDPWSEFIRVTAPEFHKPTIEQIATVTFPIWEALIAGGRYSHDRLMEIWDEARPDIVTGYAAVELAGGVPWIRMVSANPLEMRDPDLPPPLSLAPAGVDRPNGGGTVRYRYASPRRRRPHLPLVGLARLHGCGPDAATDRRAGSNRPPRDREPWAASRAAPPGRERMYGEPFLPQPSILPQCDLLISHGGNNTTTEGFHFGLPMIALPLFWDQYDNAQRLRETGFGTRLPTYDWEEGGLVTAVDGLLGDDPLRARMRANAEAIRARPGSVEAADLIETVVASAD